MERHLGESWVLPAIDDLNRPWFTSGVIQVQECSDCGALQHPPDEVCGGCQGRQLGWRECSGEGRMDMGVGECKTFGRTQSCSKYASERRKDSS